jgi:hypothetical protein
MDRKFEGWSGRRGARACAALLACIFVALTLGVAALFASSAPSFARARSYPAGRFPRSVAIGDLNGDGKPDLAIANQGDEKGANTVSVLLNRGDGSFRARRDYATGEGPESVAIGDLNGDGKPDLATATGFASTVSVLLNRGDGSFRAKRDYATGGGAKVAMGDLNGDGKPDLATASSSTVFVLLNSGDGSFEEKRKYRTGKLPFSVAIGDLNADGKPDLATANYRSNTVSVLLNRGDGSFRPKLDYRTGQHSTSVAIGDLNGDGKPDVATANESANTISVLVSRGDGTFQAKRDYRTAIGPESVAIDDLNGDGKPDLASATQPANNEGTVSLLLNRGNGRFQTKLDYRTGKLPFSVAIGDLNGDGKPDLATANGHGVGVSVLINTPGLCAVQSVRAMTLSAARRTIARANCRVGKIRRAYSKRVKKGRVISQKPSFGAVLPGGGKVDLVVSSGSK